MIYKLLNTYLLFDYYLVGQVFHMDHANGEDRASLLDVLSQARGAGNTASLKFSWHT